MDIGVRHAPGHDENEDGAYDLSYTVGGGGLLLAAVQCATELCDVGGGGIGCGDAIL